MWFLNKNNFLSQNFRLFFFTETTVMGSGNILWKFDLDQIIFLDFTIIESLKYKEIRVSGAKLFEEYILHWKDCECPSLFKYEMRVTWSNGWTNFGTWQLWPLFNAMMALDHHLQISKILITFKKGRIREISKLHSKDAIETMHTPWTWLWRYDIASRPWHTLRL